MASINHNYFPLAISADELIVDNFAGGGGASLGIEMALGRSPDIAINHDAEAIAIHAANHPDTRHFCEDVWDIIPTEVCQGRPVGLAWFSPDCKHFSKAKGGKPVSKKIRGLAWVVIRWAKAVRPRVIILENVEEFQTWGPLTEENMPCPLRRGLTFRRWKAQLENLGYVVDCRELRACDYGTPTIRKRLFIVARCDGLPIVWPEPTHGDPKKMDGGLFDRHLLPWRTAAECIDWSIPCPSIFDRDRPLAENTLRRIAAGIRRYVIDAPEPFIVRTAHGDVGPNSKRWGKGHHSSAEPLPTVAASGDFALCTPFVTKFRTGSVGSGLDEPLHTVTAGGDLKRPSGNSHAMGLICPTLIQTGYGEREGQAPRVPGLDKPLGTAVAGGQKHALVAAFLAATSGPSYSAKPRPANQPLNTLTADSRSALVTSHLIKLFGTCQDGQPVTEPVATIRAQGTHFGEVRAFLIKYFGTDQDPRLDEPLHTVTSKDRFGLVTVEGEDYMIVDIGLRMLTPRELYRAQGFTDTYRIDPEVNGKRLSKTAQVRMCGNSVCPPIAAAVARAQFEGTQKRRAA